ncbi:hypothetical protein [Staphylococcus succinus]|uniref:hypothetical protein n=1 Tax=Staphylococcus succinus TaxID=61015 RepID=UPI001C042294|nr:hypothetical protein [Staphylococcus succinus]MBU0439058.1 hypothetical protein [Staphylococcus succinus]
MTQRDKLIQLISASTREPFTVGLLESRRNISHKVAVKLHYIMIGKYTKVEDFYKNCIYQSENLKFYYWGIFTDRDRIIFNKFASKDILKYLIA